MPPARILTDENLRHYAPAALPATAPLVLTCLQPHEADAVADLLTARVHLLSLDCSDWEHAFSPWPAPRAFKKAPDFSGGATETLARLAALLPVVEQRLGLQPRWRGIAGYSLAGLFAAWSAYHASPFSRVACVSGSLWFDGWLDFATSRLLQTPPTRACFSLGDDEKNSRNPRLATVENMTRATAAYWQQQGIRTTFALNPGGHFDDIAARTAAAINWLAAD
ncbi:MAG: alpha/beta hydrolase-fold protein [Cardiobacterium sp.]